jgi:sugar phosphate isomerase/epimerase
MKFSFMTFSCPELTWGEVLAAAKRFGYDGVEPRAQAKHAHGIEATTSPGQRAAMRRAAGNAGIAISCLATSCRYAVASAGELERMMADSRALIELAHDIGAPCLRVFGGQIPQGMSRDDAAKKVADALAALAPKAFEAGVTLCVETHDSWCDARELARVLDRVGHPNVKANWDIMHPVRAGQTMDEAFTALRRYIRHCHFHDGKETDKGFQLCPIGEGVVDHRRAVQLLEGIGFQGHMSGEWIDWEPWATHLPRELATMKSYVG